MELGLADKVAVVTGAASGIGRATALAFAGEGARVVLVDWNQSAVGDVRDEIEGTGGEVVAVAADVSDAEQVEDATHRAIADFGRLDIAFNNAAITQGSTPMHETTEDFYDRLMAINLKGVWLGLRAQLRQMLDSGGGAIVNTASIAGVTGTPGLALYSAAKHAVIGLTRTAALEYAQQGIRVNAIAPGTTATPMVGDFIRESGDPGVMDSILDAHPAGRAGTPEEMASAVLWLASDRAGFVTGHTLFVDGGFTAQ
jgi:NAD(P)-dependent dehydrogenase (short-subunit alcohol dehydrogenase family)